MAAIEDSLKTVLNYFKINSLKPEQRLIFDAAWSGQDCVGVLPTGFGKSLPFQILVPMKRLVGTPAQKDEKVIVCSPLVALMADQVTRLRSIPDIKALYIGWMLLYSYFDVFIHKK